MADKTYDVVIAGGGQKALVVAMYLSKYGGLSVGLFEERHELGAGWSSEDVTPGWIGNTHSNNHQGHYQTPLYWDFPEWKDYGARYAYTKTSLATVFEEDHTYIFIHFFLLFQFRNRRHFGLTDFPQRMAHLSFLNFPYRNQRYKVGGYQIKENEKT